jgi:hypothetical protein
MYVKKEHYKPIKNELEDYFDKHHRRPRELEGDNSPRNISTVLRSRHNAWHVLYKVLPVELMMLQFHSDCEIYGTWNPRSDILQKLVEGYANSTANLIARRKAWYLLFENMTLPEIVCEINTIWIDPDYEIQLGTERIAKLWATKIPPLKRRKK